MALQGDITIYWTEQDPEKKSIVIKKYPDADKMDPKDPNYEKAGTEEEVYEPVMVEKSQFFENVYVVIRTYALMKIENPIKIYDEDNENVIDNILEKSWTLNLRYTVYESKEQKRINPENYILENFTEHALAGDKEDLNALGYARLKSIKGFEQLIDVI